jgi:hypothetical protein
MLGQVSLCLRRIDVGSEVLGVDYRRITDTILKSDAEKRGVKYEALVVCGRFKGTQSIRERLAIDICSHRNLFGSYVATVSEENVSGPDNVVMDFRSVGQGGLVREGNRPVTADVTKAEHGDTWGSFATESF